MNRLRCGIGEGVDMEKGIGSVVTRARGIHVLVNGGAKVPGRTTRSRIGCDAESMRQLIGRRKQPAWCQLRGESGGG
jgi:hypothetical protein